MGVLVLRHWPLLVYHMPLRLAHARQVSLSSVLWCAVYSTVASKPFGLSAYPVIKITAQLIAVGDTKIIDPATYKLAGLEKLVMYADTPVVIGELPYPPLEVMQCLRMPFDQAILIGGLGSSLVVN